MNDARTGRIGLLGGYGGVGTAAARVLFRWGLGPIRVGGRREERARALVATELDATAEAVPVNVTDAASLARFCDGCDIIVNCAGPSYRVLDTVAVAAFSAGAHYVDPGGDEPVYRRLASRDLAKEGFAAVLDAGLMPGLTGLLPVWLAREFDKVSGLVAHVGLVDRLTPAGAGDYLLSLGGGHGEARAAWRHGRRVARVLEVMADVELPFFPGRVAAYPYLSVEAERTATGLALSDLTWFNIFDGGGHMSAALGRLQGAMAGFGELEAASAELCCAADLDLFGRYPYQRLVFRLDGHRDGEPRSRTLVLRGTDTYGLTGGMAAMVTKAVLEETIPAGLTYAADVLDPDVVVAGLPGLPGFAGIEVVDGVPERPEFEEGTL